MQPLQTPWTRGLIFVCCCLLFPGICLAETPTGEEVLATYRANQRRLNPLHVQATILDNWTQAFRDERRLKAEQCEKAIKAIESGEFTADDISDQYKAAGITVEYLKKCMLDEIESARALADNTSYRDDIELFISGEDYQARTPMGNIGVASVDWKFPDSPITSDSLLTEYEKVRIFSRSSALKPPSQIWCGADSAGSPCHAMVTVGHLSDSQHVNLPPYTQTIHPRWDHRHPIDTFFSAPPERYRMVGEETDHDTLLTVVDALVPHPVPFSYVDENGETKTKPRFEFFRAWLDISRGAVPVKLKRWGGAEGMDFDARAKTPPSIIITTEEIQRLPNGAFYPAVTVQEEFRPKPTPAPVSKTSPTSAKDAAEVKPQETEYVVYERRTWTCSLVETSVPGGKDFFVLKFPKGQTFYDQDAHKVVGALERSPPVQPGKPAPPLTVARWLDGQEHTLEDFRGRVVVLDFWGLWCSACRNAVPSLTAIQEKYKDRPVTFIAVHSAGADADALSERIEKYTKQQNWQFLHAIDKGTMIENSVTSHAYGVEGFPTEVIIGPDGAVTFNSGIPLPGWEFLHGKLCNEITPEDEKRIESLMKQQFESAGIAWQDWEKSSPDEQKEIMKRLRVHYLSEKLDAALKKVEKPDTPKKE